MKDGSRIIFFGVFGVVLAACGQAIFGKTPTPTLSDEMMAVHTSVAATINAEMTQTVVKGITPSLTVTVTPTPTHTEKPTFLPVTDRTQMPALLQSSLALETLDAFDGHKLQRISGWHNGFDGFEWMDSNHLLLYPIVQMQRGEMTGTVWLSYAGVINLDSGKIWLPPPMRPLPKYLERMAPRWSTQMGALLASESDTSTGVYSPDGDLIKTYQGNQIDVSPSGTKILISNPFVDTTWIDLLNDRKVIFPWKRVSDNSYPRPIWSSDEMRIYASYHLYGNAKNGESLEMSETVLDGKKVNATFDHSSGIWVLGEKYVLTRWRPTWDTTPGFLAIFDPAAKTYRNLSALAGIPYDYDLGEVQKSHPCDTYWPSTTLDGRYVWVNCMDGGYLIDLATFKSQIYPDYPEAYLDWSADGNFAVITRDSKSAPKILSGVGKELKPMPVGMECYNWHPTQNIFAYQSDKGHTLSIFDVQSMSIRKKVNLPVSFHCPTWNHSNKKMVMIAEDESLWQIDYPGLDHLEQLTNPITGITRPRFSLDDTHIAFPVGANIYIVATNPTK